MIEKIRFYSKIGEPDKNGCMNWLGAKHPKGYGAFDTKMFDTRIAHRISYLLEVGEIPKGLLVCHHCDNPSCVNPKHLFLGTAKDNTQDMVNKGRGNLKKGIRFEHAPFRPNSKLTESQVKDIRKKIKNGVTMVELSKIYNVSDRTINDINSGRLWPSIDTEEDRIERLKISKLTRGKSVRERLRKLSVNQIKEIKQRILSGESQRKIAKDYDVSQNTIFDIKHGKRWNNI